MKDLKDFEPGRPIALRLAVYVGETTPASEFHELVWAARIETKRKPDLYCNRCHQCWKRWAYIAHYRPKWVDRPCPAPPSQEIPG